MRRDVPALGTRSFDAVVVGGGIYGACITWDAALRGLSVCLVEKSDFAAATSANTMKIIHGGLRYLQHGDWRRVRESIRERRALMRIAPHLIHPLPVAIPTYGRGWSGKAVFRAALMVNDVMALDRNAGLRGDHRIPRGRTLSRRECLRRWPELDAPGLTGAATFFDAQVYNSERLLVAFLESAAKSGAEIANYVEVTGFLRSHDRVRGVVATDRLTGDRLEIRGRVVVNATGPWVDAVAGLAGSRLSVRQPLAKAVNVIVRRPLFQSSAVGLPIRDGYRDRDVLVSRGTRLMFVVPWRERSIVGTWYAPYAGRVDDFAVTEEDVVRLLHDVNRACPALDLSVDDVAFVHGGLLPMQDIDATTGDPRLAKHVRIVDHSDDGLRGLVSVSGVKYTTARLVAERAVDHVFGLLGRTPRPSLSAVVPLPGADSGPVSTRSDDPSPACARLARTYGSAYAEVLAHATPGTANDVAIVEAETRHAIRCEMAQTLADVVFRRTDLGTAGDPGPRLLHCALGVAAAELGWNSERADQELARVQRRFGVPRWTSPDVPRIESMVGARATAINTSEV